MQTTLAQRAASIARTRPSRTALVLIALWAFSGAAYGCVLPFISVYAARRGLTITQIGLLAAVSSAAAALTQPLVGRLLDRTGRRTLLCTLALTGGAGFVALGVAAAPPLIMAFAALGSVGFFGARIVVIAATLNVVESSGRGSAMYARYRLCPSAGYTITGITGGLLLGHMSFAALFGVGGLLFLVVVMSGLALPPPLPPHEKILAIADERPLSPRLARRVLITMSLMSLAYYVVSSSSDSYLPLLIRHLHGSFGDVGLAGTIGAIVEIPLMIVAGSLADRAGRALLLLSGMAVEPLRFALFALAGTPTPLLLGQALDGWTFSVYAIVGVLIVADHTPREERAWSLGIYSAAGTVGPIAGPLLAGLLAARTGLQPMFGLVALVALAAPLSVAIGLWPLITRKHGS